jgi:glucose-1-phosphate adenylyltransferase
VIAGTVVNSILSPGVRVDVGAVVRDSIVMFDSVIRSGAVVDRAILEMVVVVGLGAIVGVGPFDGPPNRAEPGRLNTGITVVGKQSIVPRGARLGRNVKIGGGVKNSDYKTRVVKAGGSVEPATVVRKPRPVREPSEAASAG